MCGRCCCNEAWTPYVGMICFHSMEIISYKTRILMPPKDDLLDAIRSAHPDIRDGDCVAVSSKVVSIWEGRAVRIDDTDPSQRDTLARTEAHRCLDRELVPGRHAFWTYTYGTLISGAGIDASNAQGHFLLWPKDPHQSATRLHEWFCESYGVEHIAVVITDSHSTLLRRGALGFALAWAGFNPLIDHRGSPDLFGRAFVSEHTNLADALAAAAVLAMGETDECTPLAVLRGVPSLAQQIGRDPRHDPPYVVPMEQDVFAPFLTNAPWQKGGASPDS